MSSVTATWRRAAQLSVNDIKLTEGRSLVSLQCGTDVESLCKNGLCYTSIAVIIAVMLRQTSCTHTVANVHHLNNTLWKASQTTILTLWVQMIFIIGYTDSAVHNSLTHIPTSIYPGPAIYQACTDLLIKMQLITNNAFSNTPGLGVQTYIFCRVWAITIPLVKSSTVLHGASTPNVWIWIKNRPTLVGWWVQENNMQVT